MRKRRLWAVDCETDKAKHGRVPVPFIWGAYDGTNFLRFDSTEDFVNWAREQHAVLYAHNGGKFDFKFLLLHILQTTGPCRAQIINGRIVKIPLGKAELRDSISIIPEALKKFGKGEIDYDKMEADVRHLHMDEIITYLRQDCVVLYDLVAEYRRVAGSQITIAANALKFCKKLGVNPGKTNYTYDNNMRPFFHGGRCQVWNPGTHTRIRVIDIHSAYPFAMCHDHASGAGTLHLSAVAFHALSRVEQQRAFITLRCFSRGAFPIRAKTELLFPDAYNTYQVTGWEYVAAMELGLIHDVEILDVIVHEAVINFTPYVQHWYDYKARHNKKTHPIEYTIGKIMMNSLYGKMAQNVSRYFDYRLVVAGTHICDRWTPNSIGDCDVCGESEEMHGWDAYEEYEGLEIFRRPALWKYERKYGDKWIAQPIYNNVATGASITGFTRAHLLRAIHAVGVENVIYCDTDSIICAADASLAKLNLSDALGDWADEGTASIGHFAGKKIYGLKLDEICEKFEGQPRERCTKCHEFAKDHGHAEVKKIASKGSKLIYSDIEALMRGENVTWKSDFPSFSLAGQPSFVVRNIRQTAKAIVPVPVAT